MKCDKDLLHLSLTNLTKGLDVKSLLKTLVLTSALVAPGFAYAQSVQTFNMQVPSASSSYTDAGGNIYTLSIPSTINIGTLTFAPANSGPTVMSKMSTVNYCSTASTTCTSPASGLTLTSGDKILVVSEVYASSVTMSSAPTLSGGTATISSCTSLGSGNSNYGSDVQFEVCNVTASGTPTSVVTHYSAAQTGIVWAADIHGGSAHGNFATATGNGTTAAVTTVAGANGQPSANALIVGWTETNLAATSISGAVGWTALYVGSQYAEDLRNPASGAVTKTNSLSTTDNWVSAIAAFQ